MADERIENAYVDLYGYDPRIDTLFVGAVAKLNAIDAATFAGLRDAFDAEIRAWCQSGDGPDPPSPGPG